MCTSPGAMAQTQGSPFQRMAQAIVISHMAATGNGAGLVKARMMNAAPPKPGLGAAATPPAGATSSNLGG